MGIWTKTKEACRRAKQKTKDFYNRHRKVINAAAITGGCALGGYIAYNFCKGVSVGVKEGLQEPSRIDVINELPEIQAAQEHNDYIEDQNAKLAKSQHDKLAQIKEFADKLGIEDDVTYIIAGPYSDYGSGEKDMGVDIYAVKDGFYGLYEEDDESEPTEES